MQLTSTVIGKKELFRLKALGSLSVWVSQRIDFPPEPLETVASGRKMLLEIFKKHWKLPINTTEMKNAVCSQKNQESLREKSNGTEAAGA